MESFDVLVIGDINADLLVSLQTFPQPSTDLNVQSVLRASNYALYPGGIGSTTAIAMARLGLRIGIISSIGSDPIGYSLINILEAECIDISHVRYNPNTTSTMILMLIDQQKRRIEIVCRGERRLTSKELDLSFLLSAKMIFVVGHFFTSQDMADLIINNLKQTKNAGNRW